MFARSFSVGIITARSTPPAFPQTFSPSDEEPAKFALCSPAIIADANITRRLQDHSWNRSAF
jgi:hypothetical protein